MIRSNGDLARLFPPFRLIKWHQPAVLAIEDLYFGKNVGLAMKVNSLRRLMLAAAQCDVPCFSRRRRSRPRSAVRATRPNGRCRRWLHPLNPAKFPSRITADALAVKRSAAAVWLAEDATEAAPGRIRSGPCGWRLIATVRGEVLVRRLITS